MTSDTEDRVSRRRFLQSIGIAGVVGASGSLLAACGGSDDSNGENNGTASKPAAECSDMSELSEQEKKQRDQMVTSLEYVDETPQEDKYCANCQLYIEGEYGEGCGGCQLFPGPVAAKGYCNSWAPAT